jgi:hypothetical protein
VLIPRPHVDGDGGDAEKRHHEDHHENERLTPLAAFVRQTPPANHGPSIVSAGGFL